MKTGISGRFVFSRPMNQNAYLCVADVISRAMCWLIRTLDGWPANGEFRLLNYVREQGWFPPKPDEGQSIQLPRFRQDRPF